MEYEIPYIAHYMFAPVEACGTRDHLHVLSYRVYFAGPAELRRWASIKQTLVENLVLIGSAFSLLIKISIPIC